MSSEADRFVDSVIAAMELVTCFDADTGLRLADLHKRTGLNNSRIIRLAGTLQSRGFLVYDSATGLYYLGPALFAAGALLEKRYSSVAEAVRPALKSLVHQSGETAFFSIASGRKRLIVAKEESTAALRYTADVGQMRPLTAGASGRVALAFCSNVIRDSVLDGLTDPDARQRLSDRLSSIRDAEHDISVSEVTSGAFAVAKPVLTSGGDLLGVLTLAGAASELTDNLGERYVELLRNQAELLPADALAPRLAKSVEASDAA